MTASDSGLLPVPEPARPRPEGPRRRSRASRRPQVRRLRGPVAFIVLMTVTALALAACGAGRDVFGTNAGPCFAALPLAKKAVHGRGRLAGIRLVDVSRLPARRKEPAMRKLLDQVPARRLHDVCLVAWAGSFTTGQVERPVSPRSSGGAGRYAVAVVTIPHPELLATLVVRHEPLVFTREHVGF